MLMRPPKVHRIMHSSFSTLLYLSITALCQQICLPSIISNATDHKNEIWKTVKLTSSYYRYSITILCHIVGFISRIQIPSIFPSKSEKFLNSNVPDKIKMSPYYTLIIFKNSRFVMMNSIHLLLINNYSTISTEPEVNNYFSIITGSHLNRIRKETIKKRLV